MTPGLSCISVCTGVKGSIVVCVSPLIAIMKEQTEKFTRLGITTEFVGEAQTSPVAKLQVKRENPIGFYKPRKSIV